MSASSSLAIGELLASMRQARARLETATGRPPIPLGEPALDGLLGGGLARAQITEVVGARSSGRMAFVGTALAAADRLGERVALIDAADAFLPQSMSGLRLSRLLWIRPRTLEAAMKSVDRLIDAGGFGLLVAYLVGVGLRPPPGAPRSRFRIDDQGLWARLRHRVEASGSALLIVGDRPLGGAFSQTVVELAGRARWDEQGAPLLVGVDSEPTLLRSRRGLAK